MFVCLHPLLDGFYLLRRDTQVLGYLPGVRALVQAEEDEVKDSIFYDELAFRCMRGLRVCRRLLPQFALGHVEVPGQLPDLGLVEVGHGHKVHAAVPVLGEESREELSLVGGSHYHPA